MNVGFNAFVALWTAFTMLKSPCLLAENVTTSDKTTDGSTTPTATNLSNETSSSTPSTVTDSTIGSTSYDVTTKKANESCMKSRAKEFEDCFNKLGDNSMKHFETKNITEFLSDLCNPNISRPHVECIRRHFEECPPFLNAFQVEFLQFGPYHIKDIMYFYSIDHVCECSLGLVCVQEFNRMKYRNNFTTTYLETPLVRLPDYDAICDETTGKYIRCLRKNIDKCKFALFNKYPGKYTLDDVEQVKLMYDFQREHCDTVQTEGFDRHHQCIKETSGDNNYKQCLKQSQTGSPQDKLCQMRHCVTKHMEGICDQRAIAMYVDAVNIYRYDRLNLLNLPCSSAVDVGLSILTIVFSVVIVVIV